MAKAKDYRDGFKDWLNKERPPVEEKIRIMTDDGMSYLRPLNSTKAMRARIRELAVPARDDFDRAVIAALDDLEGIIVTAPRS